jgi:hypothetical protein
LYSVLTPVAQLEEHRSTRVNRRWLQDRNLLGVV